MRTRNRYGLNSILPLYLGPDDGTGAGGDGGGEQEQEQEQGGETGGSDKTLTQAQVNRIAAAEKSKGERSARAALLEELGITDPKEAKKLIEAAKTAAEKTKTDTERALAKATEAEERATVAESKAARLERERTAERALIELDVRGKKLGRLTGLVVAEMGDADPDDADALKAALDAVKEDFAELFPDGGGNGSDGGQQQRLPSGETKGGGGRPPAKVKTTDALTAGAERARRYQGRTTTNA